MQPVLTAEQMNAADTHTIAQLKIPGIELMERAANACVLKIRQLFPEPCRVAVMIGSGNNGGDGLAIARLLLEAGFRVDVHRVFPKKSFQGDALTNYNRLVAMNVSFLGTEGNSLASDVALIVDAIFGTGLNRSVRGTVADLLAKINAHPAKILAVDLPSGLSGSKGSLLGEAVRADYTVTVQFLKMAHVITPAASYCGETTVADIGIRRGPETSCRRFLLEADDYRRRQRQPNSHKGSFGTLAILGGFSGMEGAANLCGVAALRFGVGKVRIFTNNRNRFHHDSVMVENINHFRNDYHALIIGPGLSRNEDAFAHLRRLSLERQRVLWDADGIYYIKRHGPNCLGAEWVMTPHPGEAAELLGCLSREIQQDRLGALAALGEKYPGGWILLKGYRSLIRSPEGEIFVCGTGGPSLAVAGSGDVLSGMIGSLMAQQVPVKDAVLMGCLRHGIAGDRWVDQYTEYSMLAEDIIDDLRYKV